MYYKQSNSIVKVPFFEFAHLYFVLPVQDFRVLEEADVALQSLPTSFYIVKLEFRFDFLLNNDHNKTNVNVVRSNIHIVPLTQTRY